MDGDHGVAEPVQLSLGFALGRLDHHGAGDWPGNGRRVKSVIHEPFGHILDGHSFELAQVKDAFVGDEITVAFIKDREIYLQTFGNVIGVEDGHFAGFGEPVAAHEPNVNPRDNQNTGAAPGRG